MKISIVTVCYNSVKDIETTIKAVLGQDYLHKEHIVIDGGSTDGTVQILEKYKDQITYISEPDQGIYDALNKGVKLATGDIIGTLGAGDFYPHTDVLTVIAATFAQNNISAAYGDKQYVHPDVPQTVTRYWAAGAYKKENWLNGWMPPHLAFYCKKEAFEKYGYYKPFFRISGDYELMLRMLYKHNLPAIYIPKLLVTMITGGASTASLSNRIKANMEDRKAWKINDLSPYWYTLWAKPLGKLGQFFKR